MRAAKLKGITWDHPRGYQPLVAASQAYHDLTGLRVDWDRRSLKEFGDQSLAELAMDYDLLIIDHPHVGVAEKNGCLLPLDECMEGQTLSVLEAQSAGPSFSSYQYAGHQWALPIDAAFQCASYRPDLLQAQPPKSWDDVSKLASALRSSDQYVGMAFCPTDALCTFLSLTAQYGAPIDEKKPELVDLETGAEVLRLMAQMRDQFHPNSLDWNPIQLYDHMSQHEDVVYCPLAFNYANYSRPGFRKHLLYFANAPGTTALLGGTGLAISAQCRHPVEASDYVQWICGDEVQKTSYTVAHGQPGNGVAWSDNHCNEMTNNFFQHTQQTLDAAYLRPRFAAWPGYQEWLGEQIHLYLRGEGEAGACIQHLNKQYEGLERG